MSARHYDAFKARALANPDVRFEYEALEEEFSLMRALLEAREKAGLTQADVAQRMGITQPAVSKIESGRVSSLKTLTAYAKALGGEVKVEIAFKGAKLPTA